MDSSKLTNFQIVTIAVARLGGETKAIDSEDVAIVAYGIASDRFCWRKHRDRIDLNLVGIALRDAKKRKNGNLLRGGSKEGWMLSASGLEWLSKSSIELSQKMQTISVRRHSVSAAVVVERERLRQTDAFSKFRLGNADTITLADFQRFVRINEYYPDYKRRERFAAVENVTLGDDSLEAVWLYLHSRFSSEFNANAS